MQQWLDGLAAQGGLLGELPRGLVYTLGISLACTLVLLFVSLLAGEIVWLKRRVAGRMQARIGPNRVGWQGLLQFLADGVKLLSKEDVIPVDADKPTFLAAPIIVFVGAFAAFAVVPFGYGLVPADMNVGLFLVLAITSVEVPGVIMAGWASNSKWAILGSMREVAQMVSYEMPLGISALVIAVLAGTLNLTDIVRQQEGWIWNWYVLRGPFAFAAFFLFFTAALASLKRAPFDLPEAESELVAGFHTEYTGFRFAVFFLAEYSAMFLFSIVTVVLFLGGWSPGFPVNLDGPAARWLGFGVLMAKTAFLLFVMIWVRWSLPRYRIDKVMYLCYKVLLPFSVACVVGVALQVMVGGAVGGGLGRWLMGQVSMGDYFTKVWNGVRTTAKGMALTWRHFFTRPVTVQYPEERPYFSPHERGLHEFEPDKCIICYLCAKACPVDCIRIEESGSGKTSVLTKYEIDYSKCLFCALCVDPCPVDCIHMGQEYDLSSLKRGDHVRIDFTKGEGPWRTKATSAHPEAGLPKESGV